MPGLLELWAEQLGWVLRKGNVIVEGTSDVFYFEFAAKLFKAQHGTDPLQDLAILAAGVGTDGGVDGLNERFRTARELADVDRGPTGERKHRIIGLFDCDLEGKKAFERGAGLTRRIQGYRDLFPLHPVMPMMNGAEAATVKRRALELNKDFLGLPWEIEDFVSKDVFELLIADHPHEVRREMEAGGKLHRELSYEGKRKLRDYVETYATLDDVAGIIEVTKALRNYVGLRIDFFPERMALE